MVHAACETTHIAVHVKVPKGVTFKKAAEMTIPFVEKLVAIVAVRPLSSDTGDFFDGRYTGGARFSFGSNDSDLVQIR